MAIFTAAFTYFYCTSKNLGYTLKSQTSGQ